MLLEAVNSISKVIGVYEFIGNTGTMIAAGVLLALSLIVCFLGYKGIRVFMALYGLIIGFAIGFSIAKFMDLPMTVSLVIGGIAGILIAIIAFNLYIAIVFVCTWAAVAFVLIKMLPQFGVEGILSYVIGAVAGFLIGLIVLKIAEIVIILLSSIGGAFGAAACIGFFFPVNSDMLVLALGGVLSLIGLVVQFRSYIKKRKKKAKEKEAVKQEMKKSKEAQVEQAMNILDLDDDDDL